MKSKRQLGWVPVALILAALGTGSLFAQDGENAGVPANVGYPSNPSAPANPGSASNDPPARVARIQYISGEVSMQPGGVNDWVAANLNRPLTTSDRIWTDKNSRVELNVGNAFLRMDSESSLTFTNVSDNTIQAELDQGVLELTVQHLEPGEVFEIDTPNLAFTVMKSGVYRIDVRPSDDQTWVTARKGNGQATGNGPAVKVNSGEQVRFSGQNSLQHEAYAAPAPDGFEDWAQVRDKRLDGSLSARYVAPGVIGYQDLDYYGRWQVVPNYGAIWVPASLPVGWAPYRYGHWVWIAPWGWTWVDNAPWGFAPFHYGRWVSYGGYWGWAPGPIIGVGWRPYYAPALVGWIGGAGWGFGVSVGFGFGGGCGWFPLGWGEPFYPWYHGYRGGYVSQTYIRNVNVTNTHITNINNVTNNYYHNSLRNEYFANRSIAGAVTAAPKSALASGQNIARVGMVVPRADLGKGQVMRGLDVTPTRQAMLGGEAPRTTGVPPRTAFNRQAVTRTTPPVGQTNAATEARSIPPAPVTLGARNPNPAPQASGVNNAPRPPERYGTANAGGTSGYPNQPGSTHVVPKPPYAGGSAPNGTGPAAQSALANDGQHGSNVPHQAAPLTHPSAPTTHSQQPPNQNQTKPHETSKPNPGAATTRVPQPPAAYSYHAAPAYTASTYGRSTRSYSAPASSYAAGRSPYSAPATAYSSPRPYTVAPTYNPRAYAPATPHYSAPSASHYSSGSGGGSHASSGHSGGHSR